MPSPLAPIMDATTTMARAIMVVWLIPTTMVGRARGSWILRRVCQSVAPKA